MSELSLRALRDLELRYDGPIPAQHRGTEQAERRRTRGTIAVLETQGAQFLGQAIQCDSEREDFVADLSERRLSGWQREGQERGLAAVTTRTTAHVENAVRAFREAAALRHSLDLPPHPLFRIARLLADPTAGSPP
jgi:hypothetical protein